MAPLPTGELVAADAYLDLAPRIDSDLVETDAFRLFLSRAPWPYYARPRSDLKRSLWTEDIAEVLARFGDAGVDPALEWIAEVRPELARMAAVSGWSVTTHPLMVADPARVESPDPAPATLRVLDPLEDAVVAARAVAEVSFEAGGTDPGGEGPAHRDRAAAALAPGLAAHLRYRLLSGASVTAVAELPGEGVVATATYHPVGDTAEVLAVATLPSARRRGLAGALTALLARHAGGHGVTTLLLTAQGPRVARLYASVGFRRLGTACAAQRAL
ncbi:MAG TPA: GNAT family N-acetyltransferase [Actinomycetota bacterium]|nr:GNAT family N-acetyltransferase [Actinomycetota bacterium]